jgi:hypothetical protein
VQGHDKENAQYILLFSCCKCEVEGEVGHRPGKLENVSVYDQVIPL